MDIGDARRAGKRRSGTLIALGRKALPETGTRRTPTSNRPQNEPAWARLFLDVFCCVHSILFWSGRRCWSGHSRISSAHFDRTFDTR
jgi:hypothetical protein